MDVTCSMHGRLEESLKKWLENVKGWNNSGDLDVNGRINVAMNIK